MLNLSLLELFLRAIPESCIFIFAGYAFSGKEINKISFGISSILLAIAAYLVRMLPIHFGVHTIILLISYVLLTVFLNKVDTIKAISAGLISSIILFICEWLNVFMLINLFKIRVEIMFKSNFLKILYGIPSILLFALVIFLIWYKNLHLRKVATNVFNRENIK